MASIFGNDLMAEEKNWLLRNYSKSNGLSQNTITAIIEDKKGVIWVGTQFGIHKFDGYEFTAYNRNRLEQGKGLLNDHIRSLAVDHQGRLWAGTDKGLYYYSPEKNNFELFGEDIYFHAVESLAVGQDGMLWVSGDNGLYQVKPGSNNLERVALEGESITSLMVYGQMLFLVANGQQVHQIVGDKHLVKTKYITQTNQRVVDIEILSKDNLLVATSTGLMHVAEGQVVKLFPMGLQNVNTITRDPQDNIWVGTSGGLYQIYGIPNDKPELQPINSNLPLQQVISVYVDSQQLIWIGSLNDGLFLHNLTSDWISNISVDPNKEFATLGKSITAITMDKTGAIWQGSSQGIARLDWQNRIASTYPIGKAHGGILSPVSVLFEDSDSQLWVGYRNGPLARYVPELDQFVSVTPNLKVLITSIAELPDKTLLFTTRNNGFFIFNQTTLALSQFSQKTYSQYALHSDRLQSSLVTEQGQIWLGSFDSGLYLYDPVTHRVLKHYNQNQSVQSLEGNLILSLIQTNEFELWVGTASGLSYINLIHDEVINYGDKHKAAGQTIYNVGVDEFNRIWMSTNMGMVMYDQASLSFRQFTQEDGLPNNEFNSNAMSLSERYIYAGGVRGLTRIDVNKVPPIGRAPISLLTDFYLAGKTTTVFSDRSPLEKALNETKSLVLDYDQNGFSFGFSAVHYQTPLKVQFRYKLSPLDDDWLESSYKHRLATYTNLDPGKYEFQLTASLNGSDWGPIRNIAITIHPAPWLSPQAYAIYTIFVLTILSLMVLLWRKRRLFEMESFEKIRKKEQELSLALWGSGDEFWNYDVENGTIYRTNQLEESAYSDVQSPEEYESFVHPKDLPWVKSSLASCINGESETFELAFRLKRLSGGWFWVMSKGKVSETRDGKTTKISGANKNIDSLKRAQEALRLANDDLEDKISERTKELQQSNNELTFALDELRSAQEQLVESEKMASLGNMVAGISHEINTPLGVAITSLSHVEQETNEVMRKLEDKTLTANIFAQFGSELKNGLQMANRNLHRAAELVNSFKQVSVDQSSELSRKFELNQLIHDTVNTLRPKFKRTNIDVEIKCEPHITMISYPGALSQVMMNMMMNSLTHAFSEGMDGKISIIAKCDDDSVLVIYKDSGSGISKEDLNRVFDPFYTTNRAKGNTGLGLHICYNLVTQKLRGEILLNTEEGAGVEFYVRIPLLVDTVSALD